MAVLLLVQGQILKSRKKRTYNTQQFTIFICSVCVCVLRCCSRTHEKQYLILDNHRRRRQRVQRRALKSLQPAALRNMAALDPEMARWLMLVGWLVGAAETSALACAIASTIRL